MRVGPSSSTGLSRLGTSSHGAEEAFGVSAQPSPPGLFVARLQRFFGDAYVLGFFASERAEEICGGLVVEGFSELPVEGAGVAFDLEDVLERGALDGRGVDCSELGVESFDLCGDPRAVQVGGGGELRRA